MTQRMADLTPEEQAVVRALMVAEKAAKERVAQGLTPKLTDPVGVARVAALLRPALERGRNKQKERKTMTQTTDEPKVRVIRERRPKAPRVTLSSTPKIIERALPQDSGHCIWADALKEAVPNARRISVDLQTIRYTDPERGCRYTYLTPRSVQVDLVNFDQGIKPEPMTVGLRGGQVTKSNPRDATRKHLPVPTRATIVPRRENEGDVADRLGGKTPPLGGYGHVRGARREFGLRGLGRVAAPPVADETP